MFGMVRSRIILAVTAALVAVAALCPPWYLSLRDTGMLADGGVRFGWLWRPPAAGNWRPVVDLRALAVEYVAILAASLAVTLLAGGLSRD